MLQKLDVHEVKCCCTAVWKSHLKRLAIDHSKSTDYCCYSMGHISITGLW